MTYDATTSDQSVTMTYVMWHEEHLWNVSIVQRVHLSSLVKHYSEQRMVTLATVWHYDTHHMWRELLIIFTEGNDETLARLARHSNLQLKQKALLYTSDAQM
jgi:hypothetical protein